MKKPASAWAATILKLAATPWSHDMTPVDAATLGKGLSKTPAPLRSAAKKAIERLAKKALPDAPDIVDVEALYMTMLGVRRAKPPQCAALGSFWAKASPAFAIDVAARTCALRIETEGGRAYVIDKPLSPKMFEARTVSMSGDPMPVQAFRAARNALESADDEAYEEAKARAVAHRNALVPAFRCMVSFAFPRESAWAAADAAEAMSRTALPKYSTPLLATKLDPKSALRLVEALPDEHYIVSFLPEIIEAHGAGARGILASLLKKKPRSVVDRRALEAALG